MSSRATVNVTTADGMHGTIDTTAWPLDGSRRDVLVRFDDGRALMTPLDVLALQDDGSYRLGLATIDLHDTKGTLEFAGGREVVVPVVEERLLLGTREVETGRVVVRKRVVEEQQAYEQPLTTDEVVVERVAVGRLVDGDIADRQEGDTLILPVLEEVLVVEKRLMLKEEVRITRISSERVQREEVILRREVVDVERVGANAVDSDGNLGGGGTGVA